MPGRLAFDAQDRGRCPRFVRSLPFSTPWFDALTDVHAGQPRQCASRRALPEIRRGAAPRPPV